MMRWVLGALVGLCVAVAAFHVFKDQPSITPEKVQEPSTIAVSVPPKPEPPAPIVLTQVIDLTDIAPLLDPPAKSLAGEPFDSDASPSPVAGLIPPVPDRIPPAADDLPPGNN